MPKGDIPNRHFHLEEDIFEVHSRNTILVQKESWEEGEGLVEGEGEVSG